MKSIDFLLIAVIAVAVFLAVRHIRRKGTCSCGCDSCPCKCSKRKQKNESAS